MRIKATTEKKLIGARLPRSAYGAFAFYLVCFSIGFGFGFEQMVFVSSSAAFCLFSFASLVIFDVTKHIH